MKKVCGELIDFFKGEEGWDKDELLYDFSKEILEKFGTNLSADELCITDGDDDIVVLQEFIDALYEKIINGVCNVIETA